MNLPDDVTHAAKFFWVEDEPVTRVDDEWNDSEEDEDE